MTFWEHLDELRSRLWRVLVVALAAMVFCFCFNDIFGEDSMSDMISFTL